jgi:hypothetical protein
MANARIDRMLRELHSEPSLQFFQDLLKLRPAQAQVPTEPAIPVSLLKHVSAA